MCINRYFFKETPKIQLLIQRNTLRCFCKDELVNAAYRNKSLLTIIIHQNSTPHQTTLHKELRPKVHTTISNTSFIDSPTHFFLHVRVPTTVISEIAAEITSEFTHFFLYFLYYIMLYKITVNQGWPICGHRNSFIHTI